MPYWQSASSADGGVIDDTEIRSLRSRRDRATRPTSPNRSTPWTACSMSLFFDRMPSVSWPTPVLPIAVAGEANALHVESPTKD